MLKRRSSAIILIVSLLLTVLPVRHALAQKAFEEMVPMRDGVKLATNIFLPEGDGPFPAILVRTPYAKDRADFEPDRAKKIVPKTPAKHANLLQQGYAVVVQDCRGRYRSEGEYRPFMTDHVDGYDTVEWLAAQPWSTGKVGMMGGSAPGITANLATIARPPHLACVATTKSFGSLYHFMGYHGGVFRKKMTGSWLAERGAADFVRVILEHETYDDFWASVDMANYYDRIDVPFYIHAGWYDIFTQSNLDMFANIQSRGAGLARGNLKLTVGPTGHGKLSGDLVYPNPNAPETNWQMRWFDYWLKGVDNGILDEPPVRYYVMGDTMDPDAPGNEWRTAPGWPPASRPTPYYLGSGGTLSTNFPRVAESRSFYAYDPGGPVPTIGGNNLFMEKGPMDQRAVGERDDILKFQTEPLKNAVEVVGKIDVELWAGSDAPDTDWMVKLIDVYPNGYEALVVEGALRARFREGFGHEAFMEPGEVYKFDIDLWSTALVFNKGHRIAVHVTSSNFPRFEPNPNTGKPYLSDDEPRIAHNTIYHDTNRPSRITLPVTRVYK
jgi:predicted acyl esterase